MKTMDDTEKVIEELLIMAWNHDGEQNKTLMKAIALLKRQKYEIDELRKQQKESYVLCGAEMPFG